jgi:hypothetical protein
MHRRKTYLIYPRNYKPGENYKVRRSKLQAWKTAVRMGEGASVSVDTQTYAARHMLWNSSVIRPLWVLEPNQVV